jgi:hypothetical protein
MGKPGDWLDEFPYASTTQGGIGAQGEMVPRGEQLIQGGDLSVLYNFKMSGRPGPFLVVPIPI